MFQSFVSILAASANMKCYIGNTAFKSACKLWQIHGERFVRMLIRMGVLVTQVAQLDWHSKPECPQQLLLRCRLAITTSITVLEQKNGPQCIFGLDNMKRHHCVIDLKKNSLLIGSCGVELPFLPEHQVPNSFNVERQLSDVEVRNCAACLLHKLSAWFAAWM